MNFFLHFTLASCPILLLRYGSGKVIYALVATFRSYFLSHSLQNKRYFSTDYSCAQRPLHYRMEVHFFYFSLRTTYPLQDYEIFARWSG
ncbi:hypothetical protein EYC84_003309 [Monilinia fructicola]|uniref:Uncharacterized protein n=1 Tax=Monilinia fructicola TaxID=38448 RepID=A0A5M9JX54_MONFR|nr:hypothetical protein EYC84_003309 [Monilinia fructicola]